MALALAGFLATPAAWSQLPPAPTPVPGSLLDRPQRSPGLQSEDLSGDFAPDAGGEGAAASPGGTTTRTGQVSFGTAFRISDAGHLVTSRHVVEGCRALGTLEGNKAVGNLRLLATDPQHDLALLAGPPASASAVLRGSDEVIQGEDVLSYGFPLPGVLSQGGQLGAGMVTALSGIRNDPAQMQVDVPLQWGHSGGPLLDRRGHVIGVVFAKLNALRVAQLTGDLPQNVNFAVRVAPVKRLLEAQGVRYAEGAPDAPVQSNQQIAADAREWTIAVACLREPIAR
jgi:S1-C subfamily serine protease